jgi:hypothetical protein
MLGPVSIYMVPRISHFGLSLPSFLCFHMLVRSSNNIVTNLIIYYYHSFKRSQTTRLNSNTPMHNTISPILIVYLQDFHTFKQKWQCNHQHRKDLWWPEWDHLCKCNQNPKHGRDIGTM